MAVVGISGYAVYAFDVLVAHLEGRAPVTLAQCLAAVPGSPPLTGKSPLFVTWNTIAKDGDASLRGCIGTFQEEELESGVASYSLTAALEDPRFRPIQKRELPHLECGVTILKNFESAANPMDWEIGVHGIKGVFTHRGRRTSATFLPDVAVEQGWDKETTLVYLADKANAHPDSTISLTRYQGEKSAIRYEEYLDILKQIDARE
ncbi:hypothetical protein AWJ20_4021 [Sugiyamaella lignohabitans]|uniref:AMMECR1 domain-containing protein n=1 Tax=Sugiyamaella lignohabitans TaxID=796027 RepID=A0A167C4W0_9ASCO|nr:uncharacterized protein AWJ20_4021 [Sugiyamaella lignohabitans]ANB11219.1 hypothetical protein AWJ20_4021 [Sugiyamaella lignohabitans]